MKTSIERLKSIGDLFASRQVVPFAMALAFLVSLPTLRRGLFQDDFLQRIILLNGTGENVFDFFRRGAASTDAWLKIGIWPWWMHSDTTIVFYRPIGQWLMELDYRLWPDNPVLMHLHSVLWYCVLVLVAGSAYRQLMPTRWAAGLAAVMFAVDATHVGAVAWLANRSILPCMTAALLALLCYRQPQWRWQIPGLVLFALSLACGEAAFAIAGYLLAFEVCLSDRRWLERSLRLLLYALVGAAWLVFWKHYGYGASGSAHYIDPTQDPLEFLSTLIYRFPAFLVGQILLLAPPTEIFNRYEYSAVRGYVLAYALIAVALVVWLFTPLLRQSRLARFFGIGMLIAVIPICSSGLAARSLWFVGFGATGLLTLYIEQFRSLPMSVTRSGYAAIFAGAMLGLHLFVSPLLSVAYDLRSKRVYDLMDSRHLQLPVEGPPRRVLALSTSSYYYDITFPLLKDQALSMGAAPTRPAPSIAQIYALTEGLNGFDLWHKEADTLVVSNPKGFDFWLRPGRHGFAQGDRVTLNGVEVVVQSVLPDRKPTAIAYRFESGSLASYDVIAWQGDHFVPATLPPIGAHVTIHPAAH